MKTETYIIPRRANDETTFAVVRASFTDEALKNGYSHIASFKARIIDAVTHWARKDLEGQNAWKESSEDFNVGDLANYKEDVFNPYLKQYGITLLEVEAYSMDDDGDSWDFDDEETTSVVVLGKNGQRYECLLDEIS
jgi:hypothetical protein